MFLEGSKVSDDGLSSAQGTNLQIVLEFVGLQLDQLQTRDVVGHKVALEFREANIDNPRTNFLDCPLGDICSASFRQQTLTATYVLSSISVSSSF